MNIKTKKQRFFHFILLSLFMLILGGCKVPQEIAYFQDVQEDTLILPNEGEIRIQPDDKLSIIIKTMEAQLSTLFNLDIVSNRVGEANLISSGLSNYTVSPTGMIDIPVIGEVKVEGMTRTELAAFIKGELMGRNLAKDPVVTVEFGNFAISVLGEVKNPGKYDFNKDRITVLEAISMAGDLTLEGRRDNVTVVRDNNAGEAKTFKLDLTNLNELTKSPAYYLRQGDVVYIEPNDMRKRQATTNGNNLYSTGFWISVASLLTSIVTTVGVFVIK